MSFESADAAVGEARPILLPRHVHTPAPIQSPHGAHCPQHQVTTEVGSQIWWLMTYGSKDSHTEGRIPSQESGSRGGASEKLGVGFLEAGTNCPGLACDEHMWAHVCACTWDTHAHSGQVQTHMCTHAHVITHTRRKYMCTYKTHTGTYMGHTCVGTQRARDCTHGLECK